MKNERVFIISTGVGVIRAYDSLKMMCGRAQLGKPDRITSTNLRKYMATITQVNFEIVKLTFCVS